MEEMCKKISRMENVRFAGLIDNYGNLYAGGFGHGITPYENDEKRRSMFMKFVLETAFRRDYDDTFGECKYTAVQRGKVSIITIPICNYVLIVFLEPEVDTLSFVREIQKIIEANKDQVHDDHL